MKIMRFFIYAAVLIIGIVIGIAIRHYNDIPVAQEINLVDIATLVVTIFLAVYIPEVLDRKLQKTRDKKTLIINRLTEFQVLMKRTNSLIQEDNTLHSKEYLSAMNITDVARNKFDTITSLIGNAGFEDSFSKEIKEMDGLIEEHGAIVKSTETGATGPTYAQIQAAEEKLYNEIDKKSSILIFRISDS